MTEAALYLHLFIKNVPESDTSTNIKEDAVTFLRSKPNSKGLDDLITIINERETEMVCKGNLDSETVVIT